VPPVAVESLDGLLTRFKTAVNVEEKSLAAWQQGLQLRQEYLAQAQQDLPPSDLVALVKLGCTLLSPKMAMPKFLEHQAQISELMRLFAPRTRPFALSLPPITSAMPAELVDEAAQAYLDTLVHVGRKRPLSWKLGPVRMRYLRHSILALTAGTPSPDQRNRMHALACQYLHLLANSPKQRNVRRGLHVLRLLHVAQLDPPPFEVLYKYATALSDEIRLKDPIEGSMRRSFLPQLAENILLFDRWPQYEGGSPRTLTYRHLVSVPTPVDLAVSLILRYVDTGAPLPLPSIMHFLDRLYSRVLLCSRASLTSLVNLWSAGHIEKIANSFFHQQVTAALLRLACKAKWYDMAISLYQRFDALRKRSSMQLAMVDLRLFEEVRNGKDDVFRPIDWLLGRAVFKQANPALILQLWFDNIRPDQMPRASVISDVASMVGSLASLTIIKRFLESL
jgi:hypothetical protein